MLLLCIYSYCNIFLWVILTLLIEWYKLTRRQWVVVQSE